MLKNCKTAPLDSARGEELSLFFMVSEVEPSSLQRKNEFFSILLIVVSRIFKVPFLYFPPKKQESIYAQRLNQRPRESFF